MCVINFLLQISLRNVLTAQLLKPKTEVLRTFQHLIFSRGEPDYRVDHRVDRSFTAEVRELYRTCYALRDAAPSLSHFMGHQVYIHVCAAARPVCARPPPVAPRHYHYHQLTVAITSRCSVAAVSLQCRRCPCDRRIVSIGLTQYQCMCCGGVSRGLVNSQG